MLFRVENSWSFSDMWLMGQPFMRNFYTIYDMEAQKVSLLKVADASREKYVIKGYIPNCSPEEEDDVTYGPRVTACSKISGCYDFKANQYDNGNCDEYHSCS